MLPVCTSMASILVWFWFLNSILFTGSALFELALRYVAAFKLLIVC